MPAVSVPGANAMAVRADQVALGDLGQGFRERVVARADVEQLRPALGHMIPFHRRDVERPAAVRARLARLQDNGGIATVAPCSADIGTARALIAPITQRITFPPVLTACRRFAARAYEIALRSAHGLKFTACTFEMIGLTCRNGAVPFTRNGYSSLPDKRGEIPFQY